MKKTKLISLIMILALLLSQVTAFADDTDYVLGIGGEGVETEFKLALDELINIPSEAQIDEDYVYNSKTGEKTASVKGVSLSYVLKELAGVTAENAEVLMEASDGYPIDPQTLQDIFNEDLKYVLAYEVNGEKIDNDDIADNDEITVYRKVKEDGEFGTVFKLVNKITVGPAVETADTETAVPEETTEPKEIEETVFTDITEEFKFAETAIYELAGKGIIDGMGDGLYAPQNEFNRAQFCKIIVESLNLETKEYTGGFNDVAVDSWYAPYVQAAVESGLFQGYTDGTFQPDKTINRQEIASVAARAAVAAGKVSQEKLDKFVMEKSDYSDKEAVPAWAASAVAWLEAQGVFSGIALENFEPTLVTNRAEAAVIVYNALFAE